MILKTKMTNLQIVEIVGTDTDAVKSIREKLVELKIFSK